MNDEKVIKPERESGIELLRLLLMFMVVGLHVLYYGILSPSNPILPEVSKNYYIAHLLESFFIPAVNCFIVISGYFGMRFKVSSFLKLGIKMWFYSVSIYILFAVFGFSKFTLIDLVRYNVPTFWWFMYYYIILLVFSPFLNIVIEHSDKKSFKLLLTGFVAIFCFVPTFTPLSFTNDRGFGIVNFIFMYFVGAYIRRWYVDSKGIVFWGGLYLVNTGLIFAGNTTLQLLLNIGNGWRSHFYGYDTLFVILSAISLFMVFKKLKMHSSIINKVSPCVLGVYLIHEHPLIRVYIYKNVFHLDEYFLRGSFAFNVIFNTFIIFFTCLFVEVLRVILLKKAEDKLVNYIVLGTFMHRIKRIVGDFYKRS